MPLVKTGCIGAVTKYSFSVLTRLLLPRYPGGRLRSPRRRQFPADHAYFWFPNDASWITFTLFTGRRSGPGVLSKRSNLRFSSKIGGTKSRTTGGKRNSDKAADLTDDRAGASPRTAIVRVCARLSTMITVGELVWKKWSKENSRLICRKIRLSCSPKVDGRREKESVTRNWRWTKRTRINESPTRYRNEAIRSDTKRSRAIRNAATGRGDCALYR